MQWKDAIANMHKDHSKDTLIPLYTTWGEQMIQNSNTDNIWQEYPRPQFRREDYHVLNGLWEYKIEQIPGIQVSPTLPSDNKTASVNDLSGTIPGTPFVPDGNIQVPFSPEALLSGVNRQLKPDEYLWYQRTLEFSQEELTWKADRKRCLLHFDAVDQQAEVYVNGVPVASHSGGYLPLSVDIAEYISNAPLLLQVRVRDESDTSYHSRGKQTLKRGGMFYTAQSGIWQSVWYEWVPENYIMAYRITPDYDKAKVVVELFSQHAFSSVNCKVCEAALKTSNTIHDKYNLAEHSTPIQNADSYSRILNMQISTNTSNKNNTKGSPEHATLLTDSVIAPYCTTITLTYPDRTFQAWTPETPFLYPLLIEADADRVESYFAMRSFTVEPDEKGVIRFHLNHKPYFLHGLLDQGYWPDGLMTAPCDEAFVFDIKLAKEQGFNMLRKHIKIEPLRWYYHCDRLGMIVWQDMVNGGTSYNMLWVCYLPTVLTYLASHTVDRYYRLFSRISQEGRKAWEQECMDMVEHLYNVPSLAVWVPFNEGWGQFDAARITGLIKAKDHTRPVDHASGWFDQNAGEFRSVHNYFRPLKVKLDDKRAFVISEYGGYACHVEGHSSVERVFGYKRYETCEEMSVAYRDLIEKQIFPLEEQGLSGAVYTQLSDIEEEVNGLVTYDRKIIKLRISSNKSDCHN